jgi:hypothetical protein
MLLGGADMELAAQTPDWLWAQAAGGASIEQCADLAVDSTGNSIVVGYFFGTATFGSTTLTSSSSGGGVNYSDIFVAKMDASGHWLWAKRAGGTNSDNALSIALDDDGNSYVTGFFQSSADFGSHTLQCTPSGLSGTIKSDIFVAKLDPSGKWLWAIQAGGADSESGCGVAVDKGGASLVTGWFKGVTWFGTNSLTSRGDDDIFVAKLDAAGTNWLWVRQAGAAKSDRGQGIALDAAGNSHISGYFQSTASFGTNTLTSAGGYDAFVSKLDVDGNWLWARQAGGASDDISYDIVVDDTGDAHVTGSFYGNATFGPTSLTGSGSDDVFVGCLDSAGNWRWAQRAGGTGLDVGLGIALDGARNTLVIGGYVGTSRFGTNTLISSGGRDIFVAKTDASGNWLWAQRAGGNGADFGTAIGVDGTGNGHAAGYFEGTAAWGSMALTSIGASDVFVAALRVAGLTTPVVSIRLYGNTPVLSWAAVPGAVSYNVYGSMDPSSSYSLLTSTNTTTYSHTGTEPRMFFKVSATTP